MAGVTNVEVVPATVTPLVISVPALVYQLMVLPAAAVADRVTAPLFDPQKVPGVTRVVVGFLTSNK